MNGFKADRACLVIMGRSATRNHLMSRFIQAIHRFFFDESSPAAVEYALLIALIAVVIVVGARTMGNETKDVFEDLADFLKLAI